MNNNLGCPIIGCQFNVIKNVELKVTSFTIITSKEGLSSSVTEYFTLLQLVRFKAREIPSSVGNIKNVEKGFNFIVQRNRESITIKFGIILTYFEGHT